MSVPTTPIRKTPAEKMREYRKRKREQQLLLMNQQPSVSAVKTPAERQREYWKRKRERQRLIMDERPTTSTTKTPAERSQDYRNRQKVKRQTNGGVDSDGDMSARKVQKFHSKFDNNLLKMEKNKVASEECGDICAIESTINGQRTLIVTVYINPNSNMADIKLFFLTNLLMYSPKASEMFEELHEKQLGTIPIILSGDFNMDLKKEENNEFIVFMKDRFGLQLKTNPKIFTARNGSCTDNMIFARHLPK